MAILTTETVTNFIAAGLAAPSAENRHQVQFAWNGSDTISIREDASGNYSGLAFNSRVLSLIGTGAMIENIAIRASQEGLGIEIEETFDDPWQVLLHFRSINGLKIDPLGTAISERHTNRKRFRSPGLTDEQKSEIEKITASPAQTERIVWLDQPKTRKEALKLVWRAESERFKRAELHKELFGAVRFDVGWEKTVEEGLPPGSLEVEKPLRGGFRMLSHWPVARTFSLIGGHRMMGLRAGYVPAWEAANLAVVVTSQELEPGCMAVGRALERAWLQITNYGLSVQPLAAACLLSLPSWQGVSPTCANALQHGWQNILGTGTLPLILFRIGTADQVTVRTSRKPMTAVHISRMNPESEAI